MPASDPADKADFREPEPSGTRESNGTGRRPGRDRDRHGRRTRTSRSKRAGPRYTVGLPRTVPMTGDEYTQAVHAWAVLIAAWWTDHPPDHHSPEEDPTFQHIGILSLEFHVDKLSRPLL